MEIVWHGSVFAVTGIANAARSLCRALERAGCRIHARDTWKAGDVSFAGLQHWNAPPLPGARSRWHVTFDYPYRWEPQSEPWVGGFVFEGTRLFDEWIAPMNTAPRIWCPSRAVRELFRNNGVKSPIAVIPHGIDPAVFEPAERPASEPFTFLSVNSWTGVSNDRKGVDLLLRAFDEEFGPEEPVRLHLKLSTFWAVIEPGFYESALLLLLGHRNPNITFDDRCLPEADVPALYHQADCFVAPTRGEGFGLTILEALASGLPVITTEDPRSGHMDFCSGNPGVRFIPRKGPAPIRPGGFFPVGSLLSEPDFDALKAEMRRAYENRSRLPEIGKAAAERVRERWTWDHAATAMIRWLQQEPG